MPKLFEDLNFDSVVAPYMGKRFSGALLPLTNIQLCFFLTSNEGAFDFKRWL
jgi:hypothetical protein